MASGKSWTEEDLQMLRELFYLDLSNGFIAKKLDRSEKAIERKLYKLGMKRHEGYYPKIPYEPSYQVGDYIKGKLVLAVCYQDIITLPTYKIYSEQYDSIILDFPQNRMEYGNVTRTDEHYWLSDEEREQVNSFMQE